jgi:2-polyprenyl-3-methyl-5-hydroxy-6-metoxy-1,4-benzoquinol methylase
MFRALTSCHICDSNQIVCCETLNGMEIWKCNSCNFVFLNSFEIGSGFGYSEDAVANWLRDMRNEKVISPSGIPNTELLVEKYREVIMPLESVKRSGRILDLGCGGGLLTYLLKQKGYNVTGIEPSPNFAEFAQNILRLNVINESLFDYKPKDKFDTVILNSVIEHITDPQLALSLVRKHYLKRGGHLIITAPNIESLEFLQYGKDWPILNLDHYWYFSEGSIRNLLEKTQYRKIRFYRHQYDLNDQMMKNLNFIRNYLGHEFNPFGGISASAQR